MSLFAEGLDGPRLIRAAPNGDIFVAESFGGTVTRVREGAFYGWPWYYIGSTEDPRHKGERRDLKDKVTVPDVLLQAHSASLGLTFYSAQQFPAQYRGSLFAAEQDHGIAAGGPAPR